MCCVHRCVAAQKLHAIIRIGLTFEPLVTPLRRLGILGDSVGPWLDVGRTDIRYQSIQRYGVDVLVHSYGRQGSTVETILRMEERIVLSVGSKRGDLGGMSGVEYDI